MKKKFMIIYRKIKVTAIVVLIGYRPAEKFPRYPDGPILPRELSEECLEQLWGGG